MDSHIYLGKRNKSGPEEKNRKIRGVLLKCAENVSSEGKMIDGMRRGETAVGSTVLSQEINLIRHVWISARTRSIEIVFDKMATDEVSGRYQYYSA